MAAASLMGLMDDTPKKQGIVSILCSDSERATCKSATSLRRTLSADMSSKKWLSENGFSPIKRVASSEDIWSSIVSQNAKHDSSAPYVHPLVKRSASSLSKKSLEVCTESLGSETGSDGFSGDSGEEKQQQQKQKIAREVNYDFTPAAKKLTTPPSFPPPLPSRGDGPSLRVKPRRENGRLVLEAVSVASGQNNFKAKRHDGRLVLTLLKEEKVNEDESQRVKESTEPGGEVHMLALTVGPTWAHDFNPVVKFESRPPRPPRLNVEIVTNQARNHNPFSLNAYDYCWRAKPTTAQAMEKMGGSKYIISKNNASMIITNNHYNQEDYMVKGCKEHRRSLFREPYCIATS